MQRAHRSASRSDDACSHHRASAGDDVDPAQAIIERETAACLDEFTRRNIGRRSVLEVDDPEIGAQAQENDYPLLGATYDVYDRRVELMFGDLGDTGRHLTRGIGGATQIDVLSDDRGRDIALRIAHGAGQTLLTFVG